MRKLTLNVDGYGSEGQLSLLADFAEWYVFVRGKTLRHKEIADYLGDRGLRVAGFRRVALREGDGQADVDGEPPELERSHLAREDKRRQRALEDAERIGQLLTQRQRRLDDSYPFRLVPTGTSFSLVHSKRATSAYHVALAISLAHACANDREVTTQFETFTAGCFRARGYRTFPFASHRRTKKLGGIDAFRVVYQRLVKALGLRVGANAELSPSVHDAGADVLVRGEPVDDRPGCRTIVVQATVGKAETWARKMREVPTATWAELLGDPLPPLVTLAIPHHIEDQHLHELVKNGPGATIVDRLRLVAHGPRVTKEQRRLVERLRARGVEW